jgi:hypothetical protein
MRPVSKTAWKNYNLVRWGIVFTITTLCWWGDFPYRRSEGLWNVFCGQAAIGFGVYMGVTMFTWYMSTVTSVASDFVFGNDPHYKAWVKTHHPYYDTEYSMGTDGSPTIEEVEEEREEADKNVYPMRNPRPSDN